jgi:hypothetical protein
MVQSDGWKWWSYEGPDRGILEFKMTPMVADFPAEIKKIVG